jgi:hypothetical protein
VRTRLPALPPDPPALRSLPPPPHSTEQRLAARRAPLGGEEGLDTLLLDIEPAASLASLPSQLLPPPERPAPASGTADTSPAGARPGGGGAGGAQRGGLLTPATSLVLSVGPAGEAPSPRPSTSALPRPASRLSAVAVAPEGGGVEGEGPEELSLRVAAADALADASSGPGGAADSGAAHSLAAALLSVGAAEVGGSVGASTGQMLDSALAQLLSQLPEAAAGGAAASVAAESGEQGTPRAPPLEPSASPSAAVPGAAGHRRSLAAARASGSGSARVSGSNLSPTPRASGPLGLGPAPATAALLRHLLLQQASIADSVELDAPGAAGGAPRRPGRLELAGSEASSMVFADDSEAWQRLRELREMDEAGGPQPGEGAQVEAEATGGAIMEFDPAAGPPCLTHEDCPHRAVQGT